MIKTLLATVIAVLTTLHAMPQATQLANNEGLEMMGLLNSNKAIFYSKKTNRLWVSNGTAAGTQTFTTKVSIPDIPVTAVLNGVLYFSGTDMAGGTELWATDGTDAGTRLVKDIYPGAVSSTPDDRFVVFNNRIYFSAATPDNGREMWSSDGTAAGTVMLKDIVPGTEGSNLRGLYKTTLAGNYVYFVCNTPGEGEELWRTNGTAAGTILLKDIKAAQLSSTPIMLGTYNNKLIFSADDLVHGREPWLSDGTPAGTTMLKDIATGALSSSADHFIEFNGKMLFAAYDFMHGQELWQTDGTGIGTVMLKDIQPGDWGSSPFLLNAIKVGNKLFFAAYSNDAGMELWQTDGSTAGTQLFMDIEPGEGDAIPILLPAYANGFGPSGQLFQGNKFFFGAFTTAAGYELYISDGTVAGTRMVTDLDGDIGDGFTLNGYYISNTGIYFNGDDGVHRGELFKSDGTEAGTVLAASVNLPSLDGKTMPFIILNNSLLFFGDDGNNPSEELNDLYRLNINDVVLPVNIIAFSGKNEGSKNLLSWKAENAVSFDRFMIERSSDGRNFTEVGTVHWSGAANYSFADDLTSTGIFYYRLKLVNSDNSFRYSNVIVLKSSNNNALDIRVIKNNNHMLVNYHLSGNEGNIQVTDVSGRVLYTNKIRGNSGYVNINIPSAKQLLIVTIQEGHTILSKRVF
jgi:ELWxxDGT repeat protein